MEKRNYICDAASGMPKGMSQGVKQCLQYFFTRTSTEMNKFTEKNRFIELLNYNPQLILMLPRFGMKLGFGEKRVGEICKMNDVPVFMFLLLCNVYSFDDYMPSDEEIKEIEGKTLVDYLVASHDYYLNHRLKHIEKHIVKIANEAGKIGNVLLQFFKEYEGEVASHFKTEEEKIFPFIANEKSGINPDELDIRTVSKSHDNMGDKLSDLTNIIIKYLPSEIMPNERIGVWFDIIQLSKDLDKHAIVEEKILMPYIKWIKGLDS